MKIEKKEKSAIRAWLGIGALGALLNRIRGGLLDIPGGKIIYAAWIGLLVGNWWAGLDCWLGAQICGWGAYAGAACTGVGKTGGDSKIIDWAIQWTKDRPYLWGALGMSLRGMLWMLCLVWLNPWLVLLGISMGLIYVSWGLVFKNTKWRYTKLAWNLSEWTWGFVQSLGVWILGGGSGI